ncbi:hypothetical protein AAT19DRAFT_15203 [Rhodotorula toruloides]|uniref:Uncharacterized protein n=1 Tax=Rhodotorula toruloides TaxID=5286 RepID=A0A2T0A6U7_RHOTO|nr:hypothetical protein AAT19DRAFT_15203 [Rhodotorula toruloides]
MFVTHKRHWKTFRQAQHNSAPSPSPPPPSEPLQSIYTQAWPRLAGHLGRFTPSIAQLEERGTVIGSPVYPKVTGSIPVRGSPLSFSSLLTAGCYRLACLSFAIRGVRQRHAAHHPPSAKAKRPTCSSFLLSRLSRQLYHVPNATKSCHVLGQVRTVDLLMCHVFPNNAQDPSKRDPLG